ncbi:hypothetical protein [Candidatus Marithrix sp. Canyon 246]|uniref:hypothetical protein n=1 Tax=Candidatus Marithrix sp. Canyon 246 TaxID=1827136 RepID=UPI00084A00B4|nr:hypothetical protein [Candidatus Marithrix sp. Canyon 246]
MANYKLDEEEQEILEAFESGDLQPIVNAKEQIKKHQEYAAASFKKDQRINIRITNKFGLCV